MDEYVPVAIIPSDEPVALRDIEPFHRTGRFDRRRDRRGVANSGAASLPQPASGSIHFATAEEPFARNICFACAGLFRSPAGKVSLSRVCHPRSLPVSAMVRRRLFLWLKADFPPRLALSARNISESAAEM